MKNSIYLKENNKIILDKSILLDNSIQILNNLDDINLIKAFFYLEEIGDQNNGKAFQELESKFIKPVIDLKIIKDQYINHLTASGKASSTVEGYLSEIERFLKYLESKKIDLYLLESNTLNLYLSNSRKERGLLSVSYSRVVIIIRCFLVFLFKNGYIATDISQDLSIPRKVHKEREYLSAEDILKIENYLKIKRERYKGENVRDRIIFNLGIRCGFRKSEMMKLDWEDVDLENNKLKILDSKEGRDRVVYFNGFLKKDLDSYRKLNRQYKGPAIRGSHGKKITSTSLHNIVNKIYRESGIYRKGLKLHSLRHTFAVLQVKKGTDMHTIKTLMGHSSLETTDKYLHTLGVNLKNAVLE